MLTTVTPWAGDSMAARAAALASLGRSGFGDAKAEGRRARRRPLRRARFSSKHKEHERHNRKKRGAENSTF